uniref:PCI domain-containing protein n=1 Tax=Neobodo designis TaxID=312471 RepID=A0A7S1VZZ4_NEODS|mmetsp:Transcript_47366/g.146116  ORF Transcript_47366/g.146116 Transcript_47366/m.146116 type:complete len:410 (+) Transcript_47366:47-1276(+)
MAGLDAPSYFDALTTSLRGQAPDEVADELPKLKDAYSRQLWHEFSSGMLRLIQENAAMRVAAYDVHDVLLVPVRSNLDASLYVRLLFYACGAVTSAPASSEEETSANFKKVESLLDSAIASLLTNGHTQCVAAVHCLKALILMAHGPSLDAKTLLQKASDTIDATPVHEILPILQCMYNRAMVRQCELLCDYDAFYTTAFAFHRYSGVAGLPLVGDELAAVAYKTAIAALLAKKVFNFGELLNAAAFVDALDNSSEQKWAIDLIRTCSRGAVADYARFVETNSALVRSMPDLCAAIEEGRLGRKARLMALLHLIFHTPADQRVLTFDAVAERCGLTLPEVEPLLLTAMAQKLVQGTIDELEQTVEITWVLPRVMSKDEIAALAKNIGQWRVAVKQTAEHVGKMAAKISK